MLKSDLKRWRDKGRNKKLIRQNNSDRKQRVEDRNQENKENRIHKGTKYVMSRDPSFGEYYSLKGL